MQKINYRNYRVVSPFKFIISYILMILAFIVTLTAVGFIVLYAITSPPDVVEAETIQSYSIPDEPITYTEEDMLDIVLQYEEVSNDLTEQLQDKEEEIQSLSLKYEDAIDDSTKMTKKLYNIYDEYKYAIDAPRSDVTFNDIQMILKLCKKYSTDKNFAHLWFSLVDLEASFNSQAQSKSSSARGWGQILRGTARGIYEDDLKLGTYTHDLAFNKDINAEMSIYYLATLVEKHGVRNGLIRYNGGELGSRYADIVADNLDKNAGLSFSDINHTMPDTEPIK